MESLQNCPVTAVKYLLEGRLYDCFPAGYCEVGDWFSLQASPGVACLSLRQDTCTLRSFKNLSCCWLQPYQGDCYTCMSASKHVLLPEATELSLACSLLFFPLVPFVVNVWSSARHLGMEAPKLLPLELLGAFTNLPQSGTG